MAKNKKTVEKDNSERWLLTYSDLMNLLLILFIILYCSSNLDKQKAEAIAQSVREGFGYVEDGSSTGSDSGTGTGYAAGNEIIYADEEVVEAGAEASPSASVGGGGEAGASPTYWDQEAAEYQEFYDEIVKLIKEHGLEDKVDISLDNRGVVISFKNTALFAKASAVMSDESNKIIDEIGGMLKNLTYSFILVEGHTDSDPLISKQYTDNMDLSTQRAGNVWRELVKCGLPPEKMASIGYGEYRPIVSNDTEANKAINRRVVVTILRAEVDASAMIAAGSTR